MHILISEVDHDKPWLPTSSSLILTLNSYNYYYELHIYVFSNKLPEELAKTLALNRVADENNCEGGKNRAPQWQQSSVKK